MNDEATISMPVKQYARCIMALQKLTDVALVVGNGSIDEDEAVILIHAVRAIVGSQGMYDEGD